MLNSSSLQSKKFDGLTTFTTWVYGVGHVMNDLCAACWFNYLLYFLANVQKISSGVAGAVMLSGQLGDGIATPIVGLYSDKFNTRFGRRKPWYMIGTVIVPICFFFIWEDCYPCMVMSGNSRAAMQVFWYCFFAATFNLGWAAIQISHMSLIPSLTPIKEKKTKLITLRTAFTYISNIAVLLIALALFKLISDPEIQFHVLSIIVLCIGLSINILFIFTIKEVELSQIASESYRDLGKMLNESQNTEMNGSNEQENNGSVIEEMNWKDWLKKSQTYWIGGVYMLARLANNVITAMLPFYLTAVLSMGGVSTVDEASKKTPWELALIPLCLYIGSAGMSLMLDRFEPTFTRRGISRKLIFGAGVCFVLLGVVPMVFLTHETRYYMVPVSVVLGLGLSIMLNCAMGFISAFVGEHGTSGAFVWGTMSLFDKFSSGMALFFVTNLGSLDSTGYIRATVAGIPLAAAAIGGVVCLFVKNVREYTNEETERMSIHLEEKASS